MVDQIESNTGQKKTCSSLQETWDWDGGSTEQDNPTCTAKATQENQKKKKPWMCLSQSPDSESD